MELNEKELNSVVGGANPEVSDEIALSNKELFREKSIEDLKQMRDEMLKSNMELANGEMTQEELDNVQAGRTK